VARRVIELGIGLFELIGQQRGHLRFLELAVPLETRSTYQS
jgi:hypothetical protein